MQASNYRYYRLQELKSHHQCYSTYNNERDGKSPRKSGMGPVKLFHDKSLKGKKNIIRKYTSLDHGPLFWCNGKSLKWHV